MDADLHELVARIRSGEVAHISEAQPKELGPPDAGVFALIDKNAASLAHDERPLWRRILAITAPACRQLATDGRAPAIDASITP